MPQMAFEYLEVRHCIYLEDECRSFTDEAEYDKELADLSKFYSDLGTGWTLYGRYTDVAGQFLAMAIGDFTEKDDAFAVMNAILAPMAQARDALSEVCSDLDLDDKASRRIFLNGIGDVRNDLTDFIAQSSDRERL